MERTFLTSLPRLAAVFLALASSMAHGQVINLDATGTAESPVGTVTFSRETLLSSSTQAGTHYKFTASTSTDPVLGGGLRVNGGIGIRGADNRQLYIRHDLTNMVFATAASRTSSATAGTVRIPAETLTLTRESGGTVGSAFVVYSAPDNAVFDSAAVVSAFFEADQLAVLPNTRGDIEMSVFLDLGDALSGRGASVVPTKKQTAVTTASSVSTSVTPGAPVTASVASNFRQLTSLGAADPNAAQLLGSVAIRVGPPVGNHSNALDGTYVADLEDVMRPANSEMKFSGDFSVGSFALSDDGCATTLADALTMNEAKTEATLSSTSWATGARSLCITVPSDNERPIAAGTFMVEAFYAPLANADFGPAGLGSVQIGRIRRDGTSVQIPYLTTATEYRQRITIVNRLSRAAAYNFEFTAMDGTTVTAGDMASGTVQANSTVVLKATDVLTVTGGTEAAATLNVVATSGHIDVSTTQVNRRLGGTDTVVYESARDSRD